MRSIAIAVAVLLGGTAPVGAQGFGNDCTPAGTWYGGGPTSAKYILTITPARAGEFVAVFDQGFTPRVPRISAWSGRLLQRAPNADYEIFIIALVNNDLTPPPTGPAPDLRAVRGTVTLADCNTLQFSIDFYGVYLGGTSWGSRVPFLDPPDSTLPLGNETYQRMLTPQ